jgi:hypothetical protein
MADPEVTSTAAVLPEIDRRLHRALMDSILVSGTVPDPDALAGVVETSQDGVRDRNPFSAVPTAHVVVVRAARRYAMCSLDALGVAGMLGLPIVIESECAACGVPVRIGVHPGEIVEAEPHRVAVVAQRADEGPAAVTCCPSTVFACGPEHAGELVERLSGTHTLDLTEALAQGEQLFRDLLAETLPATRRRSRTG